MPRLADMSLWMARKSYFSLFTVCFCINYLIEPSPRGVQRPMLQRRSSLGSDLVCRDLAKGTKKVGILSKYGSQDSALCRKMVKKIELSQHSGFHCAFCGKTKMERRASGIRHCGSCMKTVAGGAWPWDTASAVTVKSTQRRLEDLKIP
ncbi:large ribosomal subunit protein eL43-like [Mirounga angustirostris]|uniref:large ribosomal subunit protein eL43-like n=1 Tax=Mirounga angustirostris TaxID=9716 RepID=UPI001E6873BD|nr:60S ribosomal protein L37a-like [Mirounga angustirostris]